MKEAKKERLKASGWQIGSAAEFLGLSPDEAARVEARVVLSHILDRASPGGAMRSEKPRKLHQGVLPTNPPLSLSAQTAEMVALCERYSVSPLFVFGSFARGDARPDSDVDLLVYFSRRGGLLALVALERELTLLFGRKVDLQTEPALSPYIGGQILAERVLIFPAA
jgi:predicted nucleotidyltransferase